MGLMPNVARRFAHCLAPVDRIGPVTPLGATKKAHGAQRWAPGADIVAVAPRPCTELSRNASTLYAALRITRDIRHHPARWVVSFFRDFLPATATAGQRRDRSAGAPVVSDEPRQRVPAGRSGDRVRKPGRAYAVAVVDAVRRVVLAHGARGWAVPPGDDARVRRAVGDRRRGAMGLSRGQRGAVCLPRAGRAPPRADGDARDRGDRRGGAVRRASGARGGGGECRRAVRTDRRAGDGAGGRGLCRATPGGPAHRARCGCRRRLVCPRVFLQGARGDVARAARRGGVAAAA